MLHLGSQSKHIIKVVFCKVVSTNTCFFSKILNLQLAVASNEDVLLKKTIKATLFCHTQGRNWLPKTGWAIAHPACLPVIPLHNPLKHWANSKFELVKGSHLKKKLL